MSFDCEQCSFQPTSSSDFCYRHRPWSSIRREVFLDVRGECARQDDGRDPTRYRGAREALLGVAANAVRLIEALDREATP
jgi:hypothetical protein